MPDIRRLLSLLTVLLVAVVAGCGGTDKAASPPKEKGQTAAQPAKKKQAAVDESGPTTETVSISDPVEDAFTVDVPKGWDTTAYSTGEFDIHREVVNSVSPDGNTVLFLGDPKIPNYWNPQTANPVTVQMAETLDYMELQTYTPAGEFFPQYADEKFGDLPGFEISRFADNTKVVDSIQKSFAAAGLGTPEAHAIDIYFNYDQDGTTMNGLLVGVTINGGDFWQADVSGLSTDGDIKDYRPMLQAMAASKKTNPAFTERMNAEHQRRMNQIQAGTDAMTQQHNANMAAIQGSAQRHQERMDAIHAAGDASMDAYQDRMNSMDTNQRNFLNYINDETTVVNPSGQNFQVDDGYQRYWMNTNDNTYVGGDINFDDNDLRAMGLNPNDYEEVKTK